MKGSDAGFMRDYDVRSNSDLLADHHSAGCDLFDSPKDFPVKAKNRDTDFPYERDMCLFSPTERSFFGALEQAVAGEYRMLAKGCLADVTGVKPELRGLARRIAVNGIKGRHIDFVAYHPLTFKVAFAVELDDRGIVYSQRRPRDKYV
jgi:hypothetical protein